jgi:hypothetical protein
MFKKCDKNMLCPECGNTLRLNYKNRKEINAHCCVCNEDYFKLKIDNKIEDDFQFAAMIKHEDIIKAIDIIKNNFTKTNGEKYVLDELKTKIAEIFIREIKKDFERKKVSLV